jgi:predicted amidohydrolase
MIMSAIQLCSTPDVEQNLSVIDQQLSILCSEALSAAVHGNEHIVVLPECCLYFGGPAQGQLALARKKEHSKHLINRLGALAKKYQVILVAGTIPLINAAGTKCTNSSCLFTKEGKFIAQYDKIHLFDVNVDDNEKSYLESADTEAGDRLVVENIHQQPMINVGLSICYDLRFPELYRSLTVSGATIITVPSAYTKVTGKAHWQALLQARAIENQVYIIAAGQVGQHENGRETWGHSMIISPWGEILSQIKNAVGSISAIYQPEEIDRIRSTMPVQEHNQFTIELNKYEPNE